MDDLKDRLVALYRALRRDKRDAHTRSLGFGDYFTDRWERARFEGFGEGSSVYDNVLILGQVTAGRHCWVGPNCILDGSGGLSIGDYCSISAGVQIYTHHTVKWATSLGEAEIERRPTRIGNGVYIGPNAVIQMGVTVGDRAVIGAMSFVNRDVPDGHRAFGVPAQIAPTDES
jgi:acetyltransferase-like isoleucine patch superfamily enzyme